MRLHAAALCLALAPLPALADDPPLTVTKEAPAPRSWVNLRGGATTSATHPELCLDLGPTDFLSVEACGTGSGFLHKDPAPEIAHFRASVRVHRWTTVVGQLEPLVGLGIAELQVGEDDPGFQFTGVGPRGVETAGPEATVALRTLYPLWGGVELVGNLTVGMLYAAHAPELVTPLPPLQGFLTFTVGVGF